MKICHFLPWASPDAVGGTEIYILNLSKALIESGNEVLIICPSSTNETQELDLHGVKVFATPSIKHFPTAKVEVENKIPENLQQFVDFIAAINPDILHFHCFTPRHVYYLESVASTGIKTLITPHLATFSCLRGSLLFEGKVPCDGTVLIDRCSSCILHKKTGGQKLFQKSFYLLSKTLYSLNIHTGYSNKISRLFSTPYVVKNMLDIFPRINNSVNAIVALSPWYKKVLLRNGFKKEKIKLIPTTYASDTALTFTNEDESAVLKIAFVGRQVPEKGLDILLKALLNTPSKSVELHLYGKIFPEIFVDEFKNLSTNGYKVYHHGETSHSKLINELEKMDVLCLPSVWMEMAPLVIQEAFAVGIPAIGSNLGGIADAITDGINGFLFEHSNPQNLSSKINTLINNPVLLMQMKKACMAGKPGYNSTDVQIELYKQISREKYIVDN